MGSPERRPGMGGYDFHAVGNGYLVEQPDVVIAWGYSLSRGFVPYTVLLSFGSVQRGGNWTEVELRDE